METILTLIIIFAVTNLIGSLGKKKKGAEQGGNQNEANPQNRQEYSTTYLEDADEEDGIEGIDGYKDFEDETARGNFTGNLNKSSGEYNSRNQRTSNAGSTDSMANPYRNRNQRDQPLANSDEDCAYGDAYQGGNRRTFNTANKQAPRQTGYSKYLNQSTAKQNSSGGNSARGGIYETSTVSSYLDEGSSAVLPDGNMQGKSVIELGLFNATTGDMAGKSMIETGMTGFGDRGSMQGKSMIETDLTKKAAAKSMIEQELEARQPASAAQVAAIQGIAEMSGGAKTGQVLTPLQQGVVWAEILGKPACKGPRIYKWWH